MAVGKNGTVGREAIMDAAERLFAERGIDAVSLRAINIEAGYSIAALHYHFATRDGLISALLARAQPPMLERRAQMLAGLVALPAPPLEDIVQALIRPLSVGLLERRGDGVSRLRFLTRLYVDRSPYMARTLDTSLELFLPLLKCALPGINDHILTQRWMFASELATHALANFQKLCENPGRQGKPGAARLERFLHELESFIAGGLRAPH